MCKPLREGGQRCAAHTRRALQRAQSAYLAAPDDARFLAVQDARAAYASTPGGAADLTARLANLSPADPMTIDLGEALRRGTLLRQRNAALAESLRSRGSATERLSLAADPRTSPSVLERIYFTDPMTHIRARVLANPGAPDTVLDAAASDWDHDSTRLAVAEHPRAGARLTRLRLDPSPRVREVARANAGRPSGGAVTYLPATA